MGYPFNHPMDRLGPLALAVMGLLAERPRHPYDVATTMRERCMDRHIRLSLGTLYHTFAQLGRRGWVHPLGAARRGNRPEHTVYALTPDGRRQLQDRLRELIAIPTPEYSSFEAGLAFLYQLPRAEAVALLRRRAEALDAEHRRWQDLQDGYQRRGLARLSLIEVELVQDRRRCEADWARRIADEIESGRLEWAVGWSGGVSSSLGATPGEEEVKR
jgi:DNA-binding PadR family transcriptional regulator